MKKTQQKWGIIMDNLTVTALSGSLYQRCRTTVPGENTLFEMLWRAYCRNCGIAPGDSARLLPSKNRRKACARLYGWYADRYGQTMQMPRGTRGRDRTAGPDEQSYTFDRLYCDNRQFRAYLDSQLPLPGNQDLLAFVLHTAVAFLVPLNELDAVLQQLGFHPLHVKNLHHLSIAYVLLMAEHRDFDPGYNPFAQVKQLYFKALRILDDDTPPREAGYSYADLETRMIRDMLLRRKGLTAQNFEALVACNRRALNMRHSLILSDFHKLCAVFIHIYDDSSGPDTYKVPEMEYSFYHFLRKFCRANLRRSKFREELTTMIELQEKHPTRNTLILLWLYAYCFAFLPDITINSLTFLRITRHLGKFHEPWIEDATACLREDLFDVFGFLMGQPDRQVPRTFRGAEFVSFINEKLLLHYGWGALNDTFPFDHYILSLRDLTIEMDPSGQCIAAAYENRLLKGICADVDNVPCPLAVITQIFEALTDIHTAENARNSQFQLPPIPLQCKLYEQL
jgi:hypothetical protein